MEISELTIKLLLLFLPGILTNLIVRSLTVTVRKKQDPVFYFLIHSFVYGFVAYFSFYFLKPAINWLPCCSLDTQIHFLNALQNPNTRVDFSEIAWVCLISVIQGFIISCAINNTLFHKFAQLLRITKKFGENSVWSLIQNSTKSEWVTVHDLKSKLIYEGWIQYWSDECQEIFLRDVIIYNMSSEEINKVPAMYISRKADDMIVEFTTLPYSEYINRNKNDKKNKKNS